MDQAAVKLQALLALWHDVRGTRPMPARGDLPASVLRPWLGNLALIDLSAAPYFRLCGTRLHRRFGGEMTGFGLEALAEHHGPRQMALHLAEARRALVPVQAAHALPEPRGTILFRELYLPLGAGSQKAGMVLFASYEAE